jgi:DNA-nicking Smr family endonuclease
VTKKKSISKEDLNSWQNYIKNPNDVIDKENYITTNEESIKNIRFKYDLHGYSLLEANKKVKEIILMCTKKKYKEILLITGKGIHSNIEKDIYASKDLSKLRFSVPEFIISDIHIAKLVSSISSASKNEGGDGAIIVKLKGL